MIKNIKGGVFLRVTCLKSYLELLVAVVLRIVKCSKGFTFILIQIVLEWSRVNGRCFAIQGASMPMSFSV